MNNAVATLSPEEEPRRNEATSMISVIERMASNPAVDVDKLERLLQMQERVVARQAEADFAADLSAMQSELPSVGERGKAKVNGEVRYTFALWEDINAAVKPVLQRFGFALSFRTDMTNGITVTGVLTHKSGHSERTSITMPSDTSGSKNAVQAIASTVSYGKRYTAGALLNLTSHGEDDDAFAASCDYDVTSWMDAINGAGDMTELNRIGADLKNAKLPAPALKSVRAAWAKRAKVFKE